MFLCSKNINPKTTIGVQRISLMSCLVTILSYIISFEIFTSIFGNVFTDNHFIFFVIALICIYPLHKALHVLPYLHKSKSFIVQQTNKNKWLPIFNIRLNHPVKKHTFILSLLLPFIIISVITITCALLLPSYAHYFLFIFSVNLGISLIDFIYLNYVYKAPKDCFVEERKHGFEVLIKA